MRDAEGTIGYRPVGEVLLEGNPCDAGERAAKAVAGGDDGVV